jgi:hypothetical protein
MNDPFKSPGGLTWYRSDWPSPVATFNDLSSVAMSSPVRSEWVQWNRIEIPELLLERAAALLMLQGMKLSQLLIPNHSVGCTDPSVGDRRVQLAHLILRVDPWDVARPVPRLTGLVLANLGPVPRGIQPTELLAALAADSLG